MNLNPSLDGCATLTMFYLKFNLINRQNWNQIDQEKFALPMLTIMDLYQVFVFVLPKTQLCLSGGVHCIVYITAGNTGHYSVPPPRVKVKRTHILSFSCLGLYIVQKWNKAIQRGRDVWIFFSQLCIRLCQQLYSVGFVLLMHDYYTSFLLLIFLPHKCIFVT